MSLIDSLEWRYATKKFDSTREVPAAELEILKKAVQLSPTSYGLQLFKVLVVENKEVREKLLPASWNQSQITDASHVFVFCNYTDVQDGDIDEYIKLKADTQGIPEEALKGYGDFMKNSVVGMPQDVKAAWTQKQTYIAMSNLLSAAGELHVDACPMEGFDAAQYNEILGLNERGLSAAVVVPVGYRSDADETQNGAKVRKDFDTLFETV